MNSLMQDAMLGLIKPIRVEVGGGESLFAHRGWPSFGGSGGKADAIYTPAVMLIKEEVYFVVAEKRGRAATSWSIESTLRLYSTLVRSS
jgi:hypothetical protein